MNAFARLPVRARVALSAALAGVAGAGLVISTTTMLEPLTAFPVNGGWLLPGLVLVGALVSLANDDDAASSTIALLIAGLIGALLVGLSIAAPGFWIEGVRTAQIDKGTQYGLLALLLIVLFGLAGVVTAWLVGAFFRPGRL